MKKASRIIACTFSSEIRQRQIIRGIGFAGIISLVLTAYLQQIGRLPKLTLLNPGQAPAATIQPQTKTLATYINHDAAAVSQVSTKSITPPVAQRLVLPANWSIESNKMKGGFNQAAHKAGLTRAEIAQLNKALGNKIDFRHLHANDQFKIITERVPASRAHNNTVDNIIAADFTINNQHIDAIRYQLADGSVSYYQPDGTSLQPNFLRAPVKYSRIGSGFSFHRYDPVTGTVHSHPAIDFDAPLGTPITATSDGRIKFIGQESGYGNVVKITHPGNVWTLYAHMRNFAKGLHDGSAVKKGEVIGYVGMTGYATGPHVHYELHFGETPVNPLTTKLPGGAPLSGSQKTNFTRFANQIKVYTSLT